MTCHVKNITEPACGKHPYFSTIAFDYHIGGNGCTMIEHVNIPGAYSG